VLEWLGQAPGKKTIVLLSTGLDTSPPKETATTLQKLSASDVFLMAVSLIGGLENSNIEGKKKKGSSKSIQADAHFTESKQLLQETAEATGGRAYFPSNETELSTTFREIARMARHEYSLAYAPPVHDGKLHHIEVLVNGSGRQVNHRRAYLAPSSLPPE